MDDQEREELVADLLNAIEIRGLPAGAWLFAVRDARRAITRVDDLLYRLEQALLERHEEPPG